MSTSTCLICHDYLNGALPLMAGRCGHVYHRECILKWIVIKTTCPDCRRTVEESNSLELDLQLGEDNANLQNQIEVIQLLVIENYENINKAENEFPQIYHEHSITAPAGHILRTTHSELSREYSNGMSSLTALKKEVEESRAECQVHKYEIQSLQEVKTCVAELDGTSEALVQYVTTTSEEGLSLPERLASLCAKTKRALEEIEEEKKILKDKITKKKRNLGLVSAKLEHAKTEVKKLEERVEELEDSMKIDLSEDEFDFDNGPTGLFYYSSDD